MKRIAIVAALPGELKPLVRDWRHEHRNGVDLWRTTQPQAEWIAACAGMGQDAATRAFAEIEKDGPIDQAISIGWAGSIRSDALVGKAYRATGVFDMKTGERFFEPGWQSSDMTLVTSPRVVAGVNQKQALAIEYYASLVDMEAAAIARLAAMRGIPFTCIKGVSDGLEGNLPDFNRFISPQGKLVLSRLLFFVLPRPWYWPALIRMGENSKKASQAIRELLLEYLAEQSV
jgi:adenosylhomocysteine nucleosidase